MNNLRSKLLALVFCSSVIAIGLGTARASGPNVIVILADDLGFSDLGCYGGEINTPHLDRLANNGLRYTQFYNTARCWPTRAALMTGFYAQQVGRDALQDIPGGARSGRPKWAILLPKMLRPLGYRSYLSGKWHIDGKPIKEGFDHSLTMDDHSRFFYPQKTTLDDVVQPPVPRDTDYYQTVAITDHAIECLREHQQEYSDKPFFHYVTYTGPHFPLHAPAEDIAKYKGRYDQGWDVIREARFARIHEMGIVSGKLSELEPEIGPPYRRFSDPAVAEIGPDKEVDREVPWDSLSASQQAFQAAKMEIHAAMVDRMDVEIGRLIEQVVAMGQYENTVIMFLSDNGASAEIMIRGDGHDPEAPLGSGPSYLCLGPGWSTASNTPFRRHKTWTHEGGTSTPLIVHWPAGISAKGELRQQVGHVVDLAPTILELAGGKFPKKFAGRPIPANPGQSLAVTLNSAGQTQRTLWWLHEENIALRQGDYKVVAAKGEPLQLYDLASDRAEMNNLAEQFPDVAQRLRLKWDALHEQFVMDVQTK